MRSKSIPYWPTQTQPQQQQGDPAQAAFMSPGRPSTSGQIDLSRYEVLNYEEPSIGASGRFGNVQVTVAGIDVLSGPESVVRRFKIQNLTDPKDPAGDLPQNQRIVSMLHFNGWPDFNLPQPEQMVRVFNIYNILRHQMVIPQSPIVVHCSAGIGRTGTFIAIDMMLDYIRHQQQTRSPIDIRNVVKIVAGLRTCRPGMVQTDFQYSFIYQFLQHVYSHPKRGKMGLQ
jgi:protein tyrosine phosphatase